jgi:hypothetical protein
MAPGVPPGFFVCAAGKALTGLGFESVAIAWTYGRIYRKYGREGLRRKWTEGGRVASFPKGARRVLISYSTTGFDLKGGAALGPTHDGDSVDVVGEESVECAGVLGSSLD